MFQDFRYSDTAHFSRSVKVLKLKNFKKDATLKLIRIMSMSDPDVRKVPQDARFIRWRRDCAWLMILKRFQDLLCPEYKFKEQVQSKKSMITTTYSQEKDKSTSYRLRIKHSMLGLKSVNWSDLP
ncbi:hypothetical protein Tco_0442528 [Tanacetum coccineum]